MSIGGSDAGVLHLERVAAEHLGETSCAAMEQAESTSHLPR